MPAHSKTKTSGTVNIAHSKNKTSPLLLMFDARQMCSPVLEKKFDALYS